MSISISERVTSNLVDLATICGITLVKLPVIIQAVVAGLVGGTLVVKNIYDILNKREDLRKKQLENEKDSRIITQI